MSMITGSSRACRTPSGRCGSGHMAISVSLSAVPGDGPRRLARSLTTIALRPGRA